MNIFAEKMQIFIVLADTDVTSKRTAPGRCYQVTCLFNKLGMLETTQSSDHPTDSKS
jgi:hypothetical protein